MRLRFIIYCMNLINKRVKVRVWCDVFGSITFLQFAVDVRTNKLRVFSDVCSEK